MQYVNLGNTGLRVSRVCLGMMSFGAHPERPWALPEGEAEPIIRRAVEGGITFFDTADVYNGGESEVVTGRVLPKLLSREELVIATKVHGRTMPGENGRGLSRKHVLASIDGSLKRLGLDYVDLYQIHRWDPLTPIEETMEALHDVIKAGKARYIGASAMWTWQFASMQHAADLNGWTRFVSMQDQYSLLYREEEREMFGLLAHQGVGSIPYSPLAKGRVTHPWGTTTARNSNDAVQDRTFVDADEPIVNAVEAVAAARGVSMAQVALAWVLCNPVVSAPIVGSTKVHHLDDAAAALELTLTDEEVIALEEHYTPRWPAGF